MLVVSVAARFVSFSSLERINDAVEKCLALWKQVLHYQLSTQDTSRFMKILVLCFFSMHNAAEREQGKLVEQTSVYRCSHLTCHSLCHWVWALKLLISVAWYDNVFLISDLN